jgi:integrase
LASIRRDRGKWRAEIYRRGIRKSKSFPTKQAAKDWASRTEYLLDNGEAVAARMTFGELLERYVREVSPGKRGHRWEVVKVNRLHRDPIWSVRLGNLDAATFSDWRDNRLTEVSPATVLREMNFLSAVMSCARRDWGLIGANPLADVRRPKPPPPRDRLPTPDEFERLAIAAGDDLTQTRARAYHAFLFACETAMRAGEICGLTWGRLDLEKRVARLDRTKNGTSRSVPLSTESVRLIQALPHADPVFGLTSKTLDASFRKVREMAGVEGLHFHDSRHHAITQLSKKLDVLALARVVGHKNISQLMTYYNEGAEELARRLD